MLHYYFFKYWSRGLVGLMISLVVGYFGLFTYSLFAVSNAQQQTQSQSAPLTVTPQLKQLLLNDPTTQDTYKKSVQLFGEIQKLKDKNQDTTQLETMYADSVKNLTNQNPKEAISKLHEIETQIASLNETLTPSPNPSGILTSITPSPSVSGEPSSDPEDLKAATNSAQRN